MNRTVKPAAASVLAILLAAPAHAIVSETPVTRDQVLQEYQPIIDRNPFGLKPPPPPPAAAPPEAPPPPKLEVFLTGIASVVGPKRVFLKSVEANNKDPNKKENFYNLQEGQSKDGIEVLMIDARKREVKIRNGGEEKVLNFAQNGIKPPAGAAPAPGVPGVGGMPGAIPGQPGFVPPAMNTGFVPPAPASFPGQHAMNNNSGVSVPSFAPSSPIRNIPSRQLRVPEPVPSYGAAPGSIPSPVGQPAAPALNPEEQYLMMKVNEQKARMDFQRGLAPEPPPIPNLLQ